MADQTLNGVPVAACKTLVEAVRSDAENGKTKWSAITQWKGGFQCESTIRQHTVHMVETVLGAYGSCLTVGYTLNAAMRGIAINDLRVEVEGDLDLAGFFGLSDEVTPGFSGIQATVHLDADAGPEALLALHEHVLKTSPVGAILKQPLPVKTTLKSPALQTA